MRWTTEQVRKLTEYYRDGKSASAAAEALGITRNAVIGKWNRLGLKDLSRKPRKQQLSLLERVRNRDYTPDACRWTLGSPDSSSFRFCGAKRSKIMPFCPKHAKHVERALREDRKPVEAGQQSKNG